VKLAIQDQAPGVVASDGEGDLTAAVAVEQEVNVATIALRAPLRFEETAHAVSDRGVLPDWTDRVGRNQALIVAYRADVEGTMPEWKPAPPRVRRPSILARLLGRA
ncbi:MAG: hypothetical protein ACXWWO_07195, partial [Candidatus Limnocylindria bacterium]